MARQFPPFAAVKAFEAAARHKSFKTAADELCLSPSAISHQIRALEEYLDTALFERHGNTMDLTLTGRSYAGKLTGLLNALDDTTRAVQQAGDKPFRILCTPGFAARWLVPRLGKLSFGDRVRLQVSIGAPSTDFSNNNSDLVIQWADHPTPGVQTKPLLKSYRFPVISPQLRREQNVQCPKDLLRLRLVYDETDDAWAEWFKAAGVAPTKLPPGPVFSNCELATTAAEQSQGVSLAYSAIVSGTLASGRLEKLFETVTLPTVIYSVAYSESRAGDPMIQAFCDWIFGEAQQAQAVEKSKAFAQ